MTAAWPVLDDLRAAPAEGGEGLVVEATTLGGGRLRFGLHRLALGPVVACLLEAGRQAPQDGVPAPAARVAAEAAGLVRSETGETLIVLETGGAALAYALPPRLLRELGAALLGAGLQPEANPPNFTPRRHDA